MVSFDKGQKLFDAGRHIESAYELANALRGAMGDPRAPAGLSMHIYSVLNKARSHIGVLHIVTDAKLAVSVDGTDVGSAPILGEILLAPGKHRVIVRGDVCLGSRDLELKAGETSSAKVPCVVAPTWRTPALITGAASSVFTLVIGSVLVYAADEKSKEIDAQVSDMRSIGYVDPFVRDYVNEQEKNRVDLLNAGISCLIAGGALLGATAGVFFGVKRHRPPEPPPLSLGVGGYGLWMRW
jgi:hypothetical protein